MCRTERFLPREPPSPWIGPSYSCVSQRHTERRYSWVISLFVPKWEDIIQTPTGAHSWTDLENAYGGVCGSNTKRQKLVPLAVGLTPCHMQTLWPFPPVTCLPVPRLIFFSVVSFFNNSKGTSQHSPRYHLRLHPHPQLIKNTKCSANHFYEQLRSSVHVGSPWGARLTSGWAPRLGPE